MVFFTCNSCGSSLKKNQVENHMRGCGRVVTCIDCLKDFAGDEYKAHTKCISEAEKYNGPDWKAPSSANKGERKQQAWVDTVNSALEKGRKNMSPAQISLMGLIAKHDNIPRKKAKFMNFISNIAKRRFDVPTIEAVWNTIDAEWKLQAEQNKPQVTNGKAKNGESETTNGKEAKENGHSEENGDAAPKLSKKEKKKRKREAEADEEEDKPKKKKSTKTEEIEETEQDENAVSEATPEDFKWGKVIEEILLTRDDHSISMKKLKKKVFSEYYAIVGDAKGVKSKEDLTSQLNKKLKKKKFQVVGETVKLVVANDD